MAGASQTEPSSSLSSSSPGSRRVLVVEDDAASFQSLKRLLEHYECQVSHAGTVEAAMGLLEPVPEMVVLDLELPDGEGTRVLEHVRMKGLGCRVVVVSGSRDAAKLRRARNFRPDAMLEKPVNFMSVLELMRPAA